MNSQISSVLFNQIYDLKCLKFFDSLVLFIRMYDMKCLKIYNTDVGKGKLIPKSI